MAPGRDDMNWLYGDDRKRAQQQPPRQSDVPTRARSTGSRSSGSRSSGSRSSGSTGAGDRRRASFPDEGNRSLSASRSAPRPSPAPRPSATSQDRSSRSRRSGSAPPPAPPRRPRNRRRRPVRTFVRVVIALFLAWVIFLVATPVYAWSSTTKEDVMPIGERPSGQPGDLWLLVGSDSREGLSAEDRERLGTGDVEGRRTDTMMLLYVPPSGKPALISIPRDSYVAIPGHGRNKINAAYALGGPQLLIETVELNTDLRVDHYAEIGFGGFVNVIDALGGIEMCPKTALKDRYSRLDVQAGCQNMDGPTALAYARMRYADPTGDLGRMRRQREMVAGIVEKAASPATVLNPFRWWGIHTGAAQSLTTDTDTGLISLAGVAGPMMQVGSGNGLTLMVPVSNPNAATAAGSSMLWDKTKSKQMFDEIREGDTSDLDQFSKLPGE